MRLWTIQPLSIWERLQEVEALFVEPDRLFPAGHVPERYHWLVRNLRGRLRGYKEHLPWWFYCEKPDLRRHRHLRPNGVIEVRLECEVPTQRVLRFPSWAWHDVYCGEYLALSQVEHRSWMRRFREAVPEEDTWPLPEPWKSSLEASWERLFHPRLPKTPWQGHDKAPMGEEAVVEELRLADVCAASRFTGANRLYSEVVDCAAERYL